MPADPRPVTVSTSPAGTSTRAVSVAAVPAVPAAPRQTKATRLAVPGGLAFLPDGTALVTLRDRGTVLHVGRRAAPVSVGRVPVVRPGGEGGSAGYRGVPQVRLEPDSLRLLHLCRIRPGRNYGWPIIEGRRRGFVDPIRQWRTADASPSGIAIGTDGAVYLAALRGQSLWRIPLNSTGQAGTPRRLLRGTYGQLRTVVSARDGRLWVVTSNTSSGVPRRGDDRIVAFRPPVQ